jgi:hypothetical protein
VIVTNRPVRRKGPKAAEITTPRIVQHLPKWKREPKPLAPDPEADARVEAFFRRMGLTLPDDWARTKGLSGNKRLGLMGLRQRRRTIMLRDDRPSSDSRPL